MRTHSLGASGIEASVIAFGAWAIGGWAWGGADERMAENAIRAAVDNGIDFIDTAPVYGFGKSEEIVGRALSGGLRHKVVLASKCGLSWDGTPGVHHFDSTEDRIAQQGDTPTRVVVRSGKAASIRKGVEDSLRRLRTDYIDLMQTHWQDPATPIEETMGELLRLKREGKIRAIGCSNATPEEMDRYRALGPLDADQEKYNALDRGAEKANLPYCAEHRVAFLAYSPLAQGLLTGKIGPDRVFADGDQRQYKPRYAVENRLRVARYLEAVTPIARERGLTLAQLAAAWTLAQPGCTHALLGARSPAQVAENAAAGDVELTGDELDAMRRAMEERLRDAV